MAFGTPFSSSFFARLGGASSRVQFEEQFRLMQNTIINRVNDKIRDINDDPGAKRTLDELAKKSAKYTAEIGQLNQYMFDNKSNFDKLADLNLEQSSLRARLKQDADHDTVTADEASNFNANKAAFIENLRNMEELYHPGINDSNVIKPLRDLADDLEALTAEAGVVDAAGTETPTNDNRAIYDLLDDINNKISSAITVTENTIFTGHDLRETLTKKIAAMQAEHLEISVLDAQRKAEDIEEVRSQYGQLLTAMSLSYENSANASEAMSDRLTPQSPEPGSILNIFT